MLLLTLTLSACSTNSEPKGELFVPPSIAMQKAKPLPLYDENEKVTFADVVQMDIETVKMYQELANNHDELVDWVNVKVIDWQTSK